MQLAAGLWAEVRRVGRPTADDKARYGDVILAAEARLLVREGTMVTVATANLGFIARFVYAADWRAIATG